jgi:hypothetical protein
MCCPVRGPKLHVSDEQSRRRIGLNKPPFSEERSMKPIRSRFVPRAEALEDRLVLSCTTTFDPATGLLQITGTNKADNIRIVDTGSPTAAGAIQVICEGSLVFSSPAAGFGTGVSAVKTIQVSTLKGKDSVEYDLTGNLVFAQRTVNVDLGRDADTFNAALNGSLGLGASLDFNVQGGEGKDTMNATMNGDVFGKFFALPASHLNMTFDGGADKDTMAVNLNGKIHSGAQLAVDLRGGLDKDTMSVNAQEDIEANALLNIALRGQQDKDNESVNFTGKVQGKLNVQADGGPDKDVISENLFLTAGSNGQVTAREQGGPGNDKLTLLVRKQVAADPVTIDAHADGGPDKDTLQKTANVIDTNVESVTVVP